MFESAEVYSCIPIRRQISKDPFTVFPRINLGSDYAFISIKAMLCFAAGNDAQEGDGSEAALLLHLLLLEVQVTLPSTMLGPSCAHPEHSEATSTCRASLLLPPWETRPDKEAGFGAASTGLTHHTSGGFTRSL